MNVEDRKKFYKANAERKKYRKALSAAKKILYIYNVRFLQPNLIWLIKA